MILLLVSVVAAAAILLLRKRIVVVTVEGTSMAPTLAPADRVIVYRIALSRLKAGQIAVVDRPYLEAGQWRWWPDRGRHGWLIKRIASVLPNGDVIVLGDNADASADSRRFGPVPAERVLGIAPRSRRILANHRLASL
jgi:signal peptidase I